MKQNLFIILILMFLMYKSQGANIEKFPQQITQPNGLVLNCFITGDEYYSWLHDEANYTIVMDLKTGYYCYAISQNDELIASKYIVGVDNPTLTGILPGVQLSSAKILNIRSQFRRDLPVEPEVHTKSGAIETPRTLNNIVVYVRFSDQNEFEPKQSVYTSYFNNADSGANSMYNYFREASYRKLNIVSSFYPLNDGTNIVSYRDRHTRNYYCPRTEQNDSGYIVTDGGAMMKNREGTLVANAIKYIKKQVPTTLKINSDMDDFIDNVCFIIKGNCLPPSCPYSTVLWPHAYKMYYINSYINFKRVFSYNFQIEGYLDSHQVGVLCHEMYHTFGAGDLYTCTSGKTSVGLWDLMANHANPPQSMCAEFKYRYGGWIKTIPEITESGHYTLNPITSDTNNCYKIHFTNKPEYFILEFRQKSGTFESSIPGTGLIISRIDKSSCCQNLGEPTPYIYIYRPDGTNLVDGRLSEAFFDESVGRSTFHNTSNPSCLLSDGSPGNIFIKNIKVTGNTVSFDVRFCEDTNIIYSNTNQLPSITNATNQIKTSGSVLVNSWDSVVFEAAKEIELNQGFEVELGGQFETSINCCGNP